MKKVSVEDCLESVLGLRKSDFPNSLENIQPFPPDCHTNCAPCDGDDPYTSVDEIKRADSAFENRYSPGIVSIDALGYVQVASLPMLPLRTSFLEQLNNNSNTIRRSFFNVQRELPTIMAQVRFNSFTEKLNVDPAFDGKAASTTHIAPKPRGNYVASTPEEEMSNSSFHKKDDTNGCENGIDDDSPRLCTLAEQGVVPLSPGLETNVFFPVEKSINRMKHLGNSLNNTSSLPQTKEDMQPLCGSALPSTARKLKEIGDGECKLDKHIVDDIELTRALSAIKVSNGKKEAECLVENLQTPLQQLSDGSNWNHSIEASCSALKPKKFRRLCKAKETSKRLSQVLQPPERLNRCPGREKLTKRAGKQKPSFAAALLVDEEAEVSSSEDVSTDEDDADDEQGSLQDFIDDEVERTLGTSEATDESIDMMPVYRFLLGYQFVFVA
ncbi:hypothetical protein L7F22_000869 [Adiantum nelumboides]|nr:hypothetical protein [Adiantum nelumboides]